MFTPVKPVENNTLPLFITTVVKGTPVNASVPMVVTDEGMIIDVKAAFVHSLNAFVPILVIVFPIVTLVKLVVERHEFAGIAPA